MGREQGYPLAGEQPAHLVLVPPDRGRGADDLGLRGYSLPAVSAELLDDALVKAYHRPERSRDKVQLVLDDESRGRRFAFPVGAQAEHGPGICPPGKLGELIDRAYDDRRAVLVDILTDTNRGNPPANSQPASVQLMRTLPPVSS